MLTTTHNYVFHISSIYYRCIPKRMRMSDTTGRESEGVNRKMRQKMEIVKRQIVKRQIHRLEERAEGGGVLLVQSVNTTIVTFTNHTSQRCLTHKSLIKCYGSIKYFTNSNYHNNYSPIQLNFLSNLALCPPTQYCRK